MSNPTMSSPSSPHPLLIKPQITVYEALDAAKAKPSDRVGIVGLGGLGHLAIQYAHKLGCATVVFSRSASKEADAFTLGAQEFHVVEDGKAIELPAGKGVDVLLICSGRLPDLALFMGALARRARIVPLIIQVEDMVVPYVTS